MKFIDSNVIATAFYDNPLRENCELILRGNGVINTICLIEVFNVLERITNRERALRCVKSLFKSNLTIIDADINLIFEALKRSENYRLNFFDLIHYSTAALNNCEAIVSYDRDFNNLEIPREEP